MRPWLKLWAEILDKEKVQNLDAPLFKFWINLLCCNVKHGEQEKLPSFTQIAFSLRISISEVESNIELLVKSRLIDKNVRYYKIHDWDDWQPHGDTSAERQKRYRERYKERYVTEDVTEDVTRCATNAKAPLRAPASETETETEIEKKTPLTPRKRVVRLMDFLLPDWIPENDWNDWIMMRRSAKKAPTQRALELAIITLDKLRAEGNDPAAVLQQSTFRGWPGLFPIAVPYQIGKPNGATSALKPKPKITPEEQAEIDAYWAKR